MDQDSFRKLLQTPKAGASNTPSSRGSLLAATSKSKPKTADAAQPAFKPRTVNKKSQGTHPYRDRASERRLGLESDYAQAIIYLLYNPSALAEDFERRNADNVDRKAVEEQSHYLGGDGTHSVLVRGLDFALFEQNRVREAASTAAEDDVSLETAFNEALRKIPRKRTREEIVQELKTKRTKTGDIGRDAESKEILPGEVAKLEEAKKAGKFKPIGNVTTEKPKKKGKHKSEGKSDRKKKDMTERSIRKKSPSSETIPEAAPSTFIRSPPQPAKETEPIEEDFDIFAGAGEYTGVDLGDDDESDGEAHEDRPENEFREATSNEPPTRGGWFVTDEEDRQRSLTPPRKSAEPSRSSVAEPPPPASVHSDEEEEAEERPMRLQPLASSALPSIRDLLELDSTTEKADKRRARKEKNKDKHVGGDGKTDKNKLERDYKRLKAYTDKKAAIGGGKM
ncbi:uncharacterized protein FIBRA_04678 [Fibroporia radiculosa]|uniref:RED-like N-terminal domain-containing protein n=1 Tax=Fibroporia radiculosa TaxID=599839 RepID=J4GPM7_9APHY|nr:uncharacterized protein FIBRA_04678 [Fibroporia radiculosa]CCM02575.1 predicted protein [Fibroporia radiculosa]